MPALAPKSAVPYRRPVSPDVVTEESPLVARASRTRAAPHRPTLPRRANPRSHHRLVPIGIGMLLMLGLVVSLSLLLGWVQTTWDDLRYGRPRTFQMDAFVGHETGTAPSHFIALNLHGQIDIIELPSSDPKQAKIYVGPQIYGPGADLVPVTLRFVDPAHTRHPDMLILFQNAQIVFHNVAGTFRPAVP